MQNRSAQNTVTVLVEVLKSEKSYSRILISYRCCLCTHVLKALADMVRRCSTYMEWCNTSKERENFLNYFFKLWLSPAISLQISATGRLDHSSMTRVLWKICVRAILDYKIHVRLESIMCSVPQNKLSGKQQNAKQLTSYFQSQQWSQRPNRNKIWAPYSSQHAAKTNFLLILSFFC